MDNKQNVKTLLSNKHCGIFPIERIDDQMTLFEIGFDSVRYMEFIVLVEEVLNIEYPDNLLDIDASMTVGKIIDAILSEELQNDLN
ncbi:phosphopantetheine-binding protein [Cytobacillus firmus]|uniref:phosphopantetheine-binding protein n=1 Tax=Cytobacillus firmus TaxID=1399 RepID=UPI0030037CF1